jgi:diphthamide synthase (EF-2-diphthine--ammonia ligase)
VRRVLLAWSSGKDSAWMLHVLRASPEFEVTGLFTTVTAGGVAVHAVRESLLEAQARAAGLRLHRIELPHPWPNAVYEAALASFFHSQGAGVTHAAFGVLFLEDIRRYRERQFEALGLGLLFPLWGKPTRTLA